MKLTILALVLFVIVFSQEALAIDTALGSFKGDTFINITDSNVPAGTVFYKLTTDSAENATHPTKDNEWETFPGGALTFFFRNATRNTPPIVPNGDAADRFAIAVFYENLTGTQHKIATLYDNTRPPANNSRFTFNATSDGKSGAAWKAGVFRIRMNVTSVSGGLTDYEADSDKGIVQGATFSAFYARGYGRAQLNLTNFTTFRDSAYTQNETRFMRGETVYLEFKTNASAWNETGVEAAVLTIVGPETTIATTPFNLTFANNSYRTRWMMPASADLNNYAVTLRITGQSNAFAGVYQTQFAGNGTLTDLIVDGTTLYLNGTQRYRNVVIKNGGSVETNETLILQANGTITIEAGSYINATGRGYAGGGEGNSCVTPAPSGQGEEVTSGGGGGSPTLTADGGGGGGGGHAGSGGNGGSGSITGSQGGLGGTSYGNPTDRSAKKGSGGGGGGPGCGITGNVEVNGGRGGNGGGILILEADENITVAGTVEATGAAGANGRNGPNFGSAGGGGGAGGTVILNTSKLVVESIGKVLASGGKGGDALSPDFAGGGGGGGGGRIKIFAITTNIQGSLLAAGGTKGATRGLLDSQNGIRGTVHSNAGEYWTLYNNTSLGFTTDTLSDFSVTPINDTDNPNDQRNTSFWVEESFRLIHDAGYPRANASSNATTQRYLQRGDMLNFSFVVLDEWNRTFPVRRVKLTANTTGFSPFPIWMRVSPDATPSGSGLDIDAVDINNVYMSYSASGSELWIANTSNAGLNWTKRRIITGGAVDVNSISAVNKTHIFVAYYNTSENDLFVIKTVDGGNTWTLTNNSDAIDKIGSAGIYNSIKALNATHVYVAYGNNSALLLAKTTNGGDTWTRTVVDTDGGAYNSLSILNSSHLYVGHKATGQTIKFSNSSDGGNTWTSRTIETAGTYSHVSIDVPNASHMYLSFWNATGSAILHFYKTNDTGNTWNMQKLTQHGGSVRKAVLRAPNPETIYVYYYNSTRNVVSRSVDAGVRWINTTVNNDTLNTRYTAIDAIDTGALYVAYDDLLDNKIYVHRTLGDGVFPYTDGAGRSSGHIWIETNWPDTYENSTPAQTEHKNWTLSAHFPHNETSASRGSFGENLTQSVMFDVDATLYLDTHVQNTSTLVPDDLSDINELLEYGTNDVIYTWVFVKNVRHEVVGVARNITTYIYPTHLGRSGQRATFTKYITAGDGWTPLLGSFETTTPLGGWSVDSDAGPDAFNNTGNDLEHVNFIAAPINNATFVLVFNTGSNNAGDLTGEWSCVEDRGNNTFVAFTFTSKKPLKTGQFNTTPGNYNINITQLSTDTTYLTHTKGRCTRMKGVEDEIRRGAFEKRNFPAFGYPDVDPYTVKLAIPYPTIRFMENTTWSRGSYQLIIRHNASLTGRTNISTRIL